MNKASKLAQEPEIYNAAQVYRHIPITEQTQVINAYQYLVDLIERKVRQTMDIKQLMESVHDLIPADLNWLKEVVDTEFKLRADKQIAGIRKAVPRDTEAYQQTQAVDRNYYNEAMAGQPKDLDDFQELKSWIKNRPVFAPSEVNAQMLWFISKTLVVLIEDLRRINRI